MDGPVLRAITESGVVWEDPSEDMLYELLGDVEREDETFFVVERTSDPTAQTYIQVILDDEKRWRVERREGGADRHYSVTLADLRQTHEAMTAWCFGLPLVPPSSVWVRVVFEPEPRSRGWLRKRKP